jgi:sulfur carrier protein
MIITINGNSEEVKMQSNLAELILKKGLCMDNLVIEHNYCIVSKQECQHISLKENDTIEIVSFVGGG